MATKLYVGNLPFNTTENELQELFSQAGAVQEVMLMQDKFTGKSRGFAFVTMGSDQNAQENIEVPPIPKESAAAVAGAALGSMVGPAGAVVGGIVGAMAGKAASKRRLGPAAKKAVARIVKPALARPRPKKTSRVKAAKRKPAKSRKRSAAKRT